MALFKEQVSGTDVGAEGHFYDTKDQGFGTSPVSPQDWQKMKGGFKNEYWKLKGQLLYDPALLKMQENVEKDWQGLGQSVALGQADQASNSVSQALAARGGGNIASALTMGAQGRIGAGLQGMMMGNQMQMGALGQYLQMKWGALTALFGKQAMTEVAKIGAEASGYAADQGLKGDIAKGVGAAFSGGGGGGGGGGE